MSDITKPNVLLIVMDTARSDRVLDQPEVMPNVHSIAEEGVTFKNAFTTGPWTLPSHASMFTGQRTSDHNTHAGTKQFDPDVVPLAKQLQSEGYHTVGISNNTWVSSEFGFDDGFDDFYVGWELFNGGANLAGIAKNENGTLNQSRAVLRNLLSLDGPKTFINALYSKLIRKRYDDGAWLTNRRVKRWFKKRYNSQQPFFMFINYLEPHLEYNSPKKFRQQQIPDDMDAAFVDSANQDAWGYITKKIDMSEREFQALKALYDGELNYLDYRIGRIYNEFEKREILDETVVIIAGDHGENLGDHDLMDHQYCLYDSLLHVPLIIRYPDKLGKGESDELVEIRDLYPTILELVNIDIPDNSSVTSNTLNDETSSREHTIGEYAVPQPSLDVLEERVDSLPTRVKEFDRALRSLRTKEWKYIEGSDGSTELYSIEDDPEEIENVAEDYPEVCDELAAQLEDIQGELSEIDSNDSSGEMKDETKNRLEDLGYLQ